LSPADWQPLLARTQTRSRSPTERSVLIVPPLEAPRIYAALMLVMAAIEANFDPRELWA
jgi:hypothetical protein